MVFDYILVTFAMHDRHSPCDRYRQGPVPPHAWLMYPWIGRSSRELSFASEFLTMAVSLFQRTLGDRTHVEHTVRDGSGREQRTDARQNIRDGEQHSFFCGYEVVRAFRSVVCAYSAGKFSVLRIQYGLVIIRHHHHYS